MKTSILQRKSRGSWAHKGFTWLSLIAISLVMVVSYFLRVNHCEMGFCHTSVPSSSASNDHCQNLSLLSRDGNSHSHKKDGEKRGSHSHDSSPGERGDSHHGEHSYECCLDPVSDLPGKTCTVPAPLLAYVAVEKETEFVVAVSVSHQDTGLSFSSLSPPLPILYCTLLV